MAGHSPSKTGVYDPMSRPSTSCLFSVVRKKDVDARDKPGHDGVLSIKRLVVPIDAPLAERDAPLRGKVGGDARALLHAVVQRDHARYLLREALHALGERIVQTLDDLEQAEIDVGQLASEQIIAAAARQHGLEIAEDFRRAITPEVPGAPLGGWDLLLEIEPTRHRMMRVVDLYHQIRDGELQLMRPQLPGFIFRRETKPRPKIEQYVRGLRDDALAGFQDRRRERRMLFAFARNEFRGCLVAALARDVDVIGAGLFQREADELAAPLYRRPVIKFVAHGLPHLWLASFCG